MTERRISCRTSPRRVAEASRPTDHRFLISIRGTSPDRRPHLTCIIMLALPYRGLFEIYIQYAVGAINVATTDLLFFLSFSLLPFIISYYYVAVYRSIYIDQTLLLRVQIYYKDIIIVCTFLFKAKLEKKVEKYLGFMGGLTLTMDSFGRAAHL